MGFSSSVNGLRHVFTRKSDSVIGATSGIVNGLAKLIATNKLIARQIYDKMY
jgi:hypothetical protein